jgi:hypothetical protein
LSQPAGEEEEAEKGEGEEASHFGSFVIFEGMVHRRHRENRGTQKVFLNSFCVLL